MSEHSDDLRRRSPLPVWPHGLFRVTFKCRNSRLVSLIGCVERTVTVSSVPGAGVIECVIRSTEDDDQSVDVLGSAGIWQYFPAAGRVLTPTAPDAQSSARYLDEPGTEGVHNQPGNVSNLQLAHQVCAMRIDRAHADAEL